MTILHGQNQLLLCSMFFKIHIGTYNQQENRDFCDLFLEAIIHFEKIHLGESPGSCLSGATVCRQNISLFFMEKVP